MNENELIAVIKIDKETRRPEIDFKGVWTGKWVKLVIAKMPKAYRKHASERLKLLEKTEKEIKGEGDDGTGKPKRTGEPARTTTARRTGRPKKRRGNIKKRSTGLKKRERADSERKTGQPDKFLVPETTAGTAEAAERSTVDEQKPSTGTTAY
jgi:hypothetical protein